MIFVLLVKEVSLKFYLQSNCGDRFIIDIYLSLSLLASITKSWWFFWESWELPEVWLAPALFWTSSWCREGLIYHIFLFILVLFSFRSTRLFDIFLDFESLKVAMTGSLQTCFELHHDVGMRRGPIYYIYIYLFWPLLLASIVKLRWFFWEGFEVVRFAPELANSIIFKL